MSSSRLFEFMCFFLVVFLDTERRTNTRDNRTQSQDSGYMIFHRKFNVLESLSFFLIEKYCIVQCACAELDEKFTTLCCRVEKQQQSRTEQAMISFFCC